MSQNPIDPGKILGENVPYPFAAPDGDGNAQTDSEPQARQPQGESKIPAIFEPGKTDPFEIFQSAGSRQGIYGQLGGLAVSQDVKGRLPVPGDETFLKHPQGGVPPGG